MAIELWSQTKLFISPSGPEDVVRKADITMTHGVWDDTAYWNDAETWEDAI